MGLRKQIKVKLLTGRTYSFEELKRQYPDMMHNDLLRVIWTLVNNGEAVFTKDRRVTASRKKPKYRYDKRTN